MIMKLSGVERDILAETQEMVIQSAIEEHIRRTKELIISLEHQLELFKKNKDLSIYRYNQARLLFSFIQQQSQLLNEINMKNLSTIADVALLFEPIKIANNNDAVIIQNNKTELRA